MDEKSNHVKVVIIRHQNDCGWYTFRVPDDIVLSAGDAVLCDTSKGRGQVGYCVTDSYWIDTDKLGPLLDVSSVKKLKPVTALLKPIYFDLAEEQ